MKTIYFLILVALLTSLRPVDPEFSIIGKWNWIKSKGGISGKAIVTPQKTGHTKQFIFDTNDKVTIIEDSKTTSVSNYGVEKRKSLILNEIKPMLTIIRTVKNTKDNASFLDSARYILTLKQDTLELDEDVYDGFGHIYVRSK